MAKSRLHELSELGQSVWIDYLSRHLLQSGELARMMEEDAVVGVTSNPTIFQKAIAEGDAYDEQLREVLAEEQDPKEVFLKLAVQDVRNACDLLRPVWDGGQGQDGYVSIEVDPNLAYDTQGTIDEAQRLHELVDKPNCFVKIPATEPGLPAIEEMIARGRSINVTLIFSLQRYVEVVEAYLRGLERLVENGGDPRPVASVASFFVSRVDTEADRRLGEAGAPTELMGKLAVANAKLAYQRYQELFSGERWEALHAKGARSQRCLWASTSTKNPDYRDVIYVEELIGPETVNTMPEETIEAFQDHGEVALSLERDVDEAKRVFERVAEAGVDYDDVVATLEREGVDKFADSFKELLDGVQAKRGELVSAEALRVAIYAEVAGEGPALALVHEGICDSRMWDEQWERYAESFRVLRLDLRGFGRTPLEPGPFAHARDVIETLEQHDFGPTALLGVSLGGRVALEVALARPELVSALVLVAPGLPGHEWSEGLRAEWAKEEAAFEAGDLDAAVEVSLRTWVDGPRRSPDEVDRALRARVAEMQRRAYELQRDVTEDEEELLVEDLPQRLGDVRVPTLVLVGEEDQPDMHAIVERLAREIPGARSATIAGTAHVPSMERPRDFDELVLPFLRETG